MTSRRVVALRVALFALAAFAGVWAITMARDDSAVARVAYACPMHPEVTSTTRGACPICGMDLELVATGAAPAIRPSSYLTYDTERRRAYGPDAPAPAWVEDDGTISALLYRDELAYRVADEHAQFSPAETPALAIDVIASADAPAAWDRATAHVRFKLGTASVQPLRPGTVGWLRHPRSPEPPVVPMSAVLEDASGPYVLMAISNGHGLARRNVEIGRVFGGAAAVVSGLRTSDRVLTGSTFFVDAERRLRGGAEIDTAAR
jgi:hypothetical protein